MMKLENLREETESALYGLTADDSLKYRILQKAAQTPAETTKKGFHPFPVLCSVLAVLLLLTVALNHVRPLTPVEPGEMTVFAAGGKEEGSTSVFSSISASDIVSMELTSVGKLESSEKCAQLLSMLQQESFPAADEKWDNNEYLIISTSDGQSVKYPVNEPYFLYNTCWECQSFFDLFRNSIGK